MAGGRGEGGFWSMLREGGVPSAIASVMGTPSAQQIAFIRSLMRELRRPDVLRTPLYELETVVFDLETTGFHAQHGDEIISFGAIKVDGLDIRANDQFYTLVQSKRPVPAGITELTGITQQMLEQAPSIMEGLHRFMHFVGKRVLIAHASSHDKSFLNAALWKTSKVSLGHRVLDTMMLAGELDPALRGCTLDELLDRWGIPVTGRHQALEDAKMTAHLWVRLLDEIGRKTQVDTLGDLYTYLSQR